MAAVALLLILGFAAAEEPPAFPIEDTLALAPDTADVVIYVNFDGLVAPAWRWLNDELVKMPFIKGAPEMERELSRGLSELEGAIVQANGVTGMDLLHDVHDAIAWVRLADPDPEKFDLLAAVRGEFKDGFLASNAATLSLTGRKVGKVTIYETTKGSGPAFAAFQRGDRLVLGTVAWVEERATGMTFKKGAAATLTEQFLRTRPIAAVAVAPGKNLLRLLTAKSTSVSANAFFEGFEWQIASMRADGVDFTLVARDDESYARYKLFADGMVELTRAGQHGSRGLGKMALGILSPDDPDLGPEATKILAQRDALVALIDEMLGTADLRVVDNSKRAARRVELSLRAGHVREVVLPMVLVIGGAVAASF